MNSINVNIPVVNMPQVSHHQSDVHRVPMTHQAQNADMARDRLDLLVRTAHEAEEAEDKVVDPKERRDEKRQSKKRGQNEDANSDENEGRPSDIDTTMSDSGRFIDLEA